MTKFPDEYLGDGVYAKCDGWYIWLTTDACPSGIAIEPEVLDALNKYSQKILKLASEKHTPEEYDG